MNRSDFLRVIETSGPADRQTISEISELIGIFPYFQSAYVLLLKGLQNTSDVRFENQLRASAMHIANREVLYYFLQKEPVTMSEIPAPVPIMDQSENDKTDTSQVVIESAKSSEELINEIEKESSGKITSDKPDEYTIEITAESGYKDSDATIIVVNKDTGEIEERVTFLDPGFSVPEDADLLELEAEHDKTADSPMMPTMPDQEAVKETPSPKQIQADLIDKFIITNPKIGPVKVKSDTPIVDISKPYVEEREGFITETLARIYVKQGYYSRAIDIYERLSLKFPEKSSYFASLIEEVKELIKK